MIGLIIMICVWQMIWKTAPYRKCIYFTNVIVYTGIFFNNFIYTGIIYNHIYMLYGSVETLNCTINI